MAAFQQHVTSCDPDNMAPCEYCQCLYKFYQLDDHSRYCRNISEQQRQQAFLDFILPKLKYPFTPVQVRFYIEQQRQNRRVLDPHEIVDTLAAFEDKFPFEQYHYRTTCQQVVQITQRWFVWCNTERGNYWRVRAQQDATYRAQLDEYERQLAANTQRNEELQRRYNELKADEAFKAQNCRLCPHCKRVTQHMGGCSSMVCGRNYHGGDQQSGCGNNFNWDQAEPYIPITNRPLEQIKNDLPRLENKQRVVHTGIRCDGCHNDVEGILFSCIHCPSLIYCEKCEQRCTLAHSEELRQQKKQQHVFQLITTPEVLHIRQRR
ncbi:unnamed protein product [Rotaria sordida]|uniref:Uncharacterized protein n=1 Tax=Rotaria sordida TaxID=392033 RepID=A0A816DSU4_9BILA|nr:unnamed protein product [Rotaria sordida]CAF1640570.1 unnamed protein product [Rotaria sordida]